MSGQRITITDEQYAEWDGTPEDLAAIAGREELARATLGDEATHVPGGRQITYRIETSVSRAAATLGRKGGRSGGPRAREDR